MQFTSREPELLEVVRYDYIFFYETVVNHEDRPCLVVAVDAGRRHSSL